MTGLFHREVTRYLRAVQFPAEREDLQRAATAAGAGQAVLARLARVGDRTYQGTAQIDEELNRLASGEGLAEDGRPTVDKLSEDSFPASDPPGSGGATGVGRPPTGG